MRKTALLPVLILVLQPCFAQHSDSTFLTENTFSRSLFPKNKFVLKPHYYPITLIATGLALSGNHPESVKNEIVEERNEHLYNFRTHVDDYLQFSPIAIAYGLDAFGVKSKTDIQNRTVILIKGELCVGLVTQVLKRTTHVQRPDFSNYHSFPSGHTAQAFAAATFLSEEYGHRFKWIPYVSYGIATSVGFLRMANNKHYISDVLVGAGIGILSMKVSYWTHQYKWNKKRNSNFLRNRM
ncbi:MAG: phosphatase PAP2 family protein [Cyclobacteriaceae bacterium]|nr:phosphatase PAP2 family protein [Cyclobacteriaceae bacterium]